jgi:hypothetical protein
LWCLRIERRLLEVDGWFRAAGGIEYLVLKGPAVAHLDEVDPSLRAFVDVDLLVAARHMDRALEVLAENGVQRRLPRRRAGFDRRFGKGVGCRSADGVEVDVHRTLTTGALGLRIPLDELFEAPEPFEVGGVDLRAPALPHRALHAAYHAVVGTAVPPLRTVRDLAGYLSRPDIAPEVLVPIARRWGGETVLALAVEATLDTLAFEAPAWAAWLARTRPDPRDVALVARSRTASAWPVEWSVLRELGPVDGTRFAWSVAFPDPSFLEHRGHSRRARLRAGLGRLRRG